MIVADTNLIVPLFVPTPQSDLACVALQRDPEWSAPSLWRSELRNALISYLRAELIDRSYMLGAVDAAEDRLSPNTFEVTHQAVLDLAAASGCTAYDCEYVALARELDAPLVTLDRQILRAFPEIAVSLPSFVATESS